MVLIGPIPGDFFVKLDGDGISTGSAISVELVAVELVVVVNEPLWSKSNKFLFVKVAELFPGLTVSIGFFVLESIGLPAIVILRAGEGGWEAENEADPDPETDVDPETEIELG